MARGVTVARNASTASMGAPPRRVSSASAPRLFSLRATSGRWRISTVWHPWVAPTRPTIQTSKSAMTRYTGRFKGGRGGGGVNGGSDTARAIYHVAPRAATLGRLRDLLGARTVGLDVRSAALLPSSSIHGATYASWARGEQGIRHDDRGTRTSTSGA